MEILAEFIRNRPILSRLLMPEYALREKFPELTREYVDRWREAGVPEGLIEDALRLAEDAARGMWMRIGGYKLSPEEQEKMLKNLYKTFLEGAEKWIKEWAKAYGFEIMLGSTIYVAPQVEIDEKIARLKREYTEKWREMGATEMLIQRALSLVDAHVMGIAEKASATDEALKRKIIEMYYPEALETVGTEYVRRMIEKFRELGY